MSRWTGDVCIVGAGISGVFTALRLAQASRRSLRIAVVDAGPVYKFEDRFDNRQRSIDYDENPWPDDSPSEFAPKNCPENTMGVGGRALHWNGNAWRYSSEDFRQRSLYGVGADWPIGYAEIEPYYCRVKDKERRFFVGGQVRLSSAWASFASENVDSVYSR